MPNDAKPADGVREAVEKAARQCLARLVSNRYCPSYNESGQKAIYGLIVRAITPHLAALVAEVRLQDAKAVCPMCRDGEEYGTLYMMDVVKSGGYWCHRNVGGRGLVPCRALPIHDLLKETEENE